MSTETEKTAGPKLEALKATFTSPEAKKTLTNALILGGVGVGIGAGATALDAGSKAVSDPVHRHFAFKQVEKKNPWLKDHDKELVHSYYKTLFNFAPSMAKDPLVAGSFLKRQLEYKDIGPQAADLQTITNIDNAIRDRKTKSLLSNSFGSGSIKSMHGVGENLVKPPRPPQENKHHNNHFNDHFHDESNGN